MPRVAARVDSDLYSRFKEWYEAHPHIEDESQAVRAAMREVTDEHQIEEFDSL